MPSQVKLIKRRTLTFYPGYGYLTAAESSLQVQLPAGKRKCTVTKKASMTVNGKGLVGDWVVVVVVLK